MANDAGPRQHVVLRSRGFPVPGAPEPPESGILIEARSAYRRLPSKPTPWDRIAPGERIWLLFDGGIVATAVVDRVTQLEDCSATDLRELAVGYQLHNAEAYWRRLSREGVVGRLSAVVIWTRDEERREPPLKRLAGFQTMDLGEALGSSWIVVDSSEPTRRSWLRPGSASELAEVDNPPGVADESAGSEHGPTSGNSLALFGCLLFCFIGVGVLVVVILNWVL